MNNVYVFHHDDLDGLCAAAIVRYKYEAAQCIEMRYGRRVEEEFFETLKEGDQVYIVDFSLGADEMARLSDAGADIIWLDHHKTAIEKLADYSKVRGTRDIGKAGCELTWEYIFPEKDMPLAVQMLGRYDVWDHSNPMVVPYYYGMMVLDADPNKHMDLWKAVFETNRDGDNERWNFDDQVLSMGHMILSYRFIRDQRTMDKSFRVKFHGHQALCVNAQLEDSYAFKTHIEDGDEMLIWYYQMPNGKWKYSVRTVEQADGTSLDISEIATKYPGGGGHAGSAGFVSAELELKPE